MEDVRHQIVHGRARRRIARLDRAALAHIGPERLARERAIGTGFLVQRADLCVELGRLGHAHHVVAVGIDLDDAALGRERPDPRVVDVARVVEHRFRARMRQDDRRRRQRQHLVEREVRGMRRIDHDAEPVGFRDELPPSCDSPCHSGPFGSVAEIAQIVVGEMHRPDHAHAEIVEGLDERQVPPDRVGVLHALVDDAPARRDDPGGVIGFGRQREHSRCCAPPSRGFPPRASAPGRAPPHNPRGVRGPWLV